MAVTGKNGDGRSCQRHSESRQLSENAPGVMDCQLEGVVNCLRRHGALIDVWRTGYCSRRQWTVFSWKKLHDLTKLCPRNTVPNLTQELVSMEDNYSLRQMSGFEYDVLS